MPQTLQGGGPEAATEVVAEAGAERTAVALRKLVGFRGSGAASSGAGGGGGDGGWASMLAGLCAAAEGGGSADGGGGGGGGEDPYGMHFLYAPKNTAVFDPGTGKSNFYGLGFDPYTDAPEFRAVSTGQQRCVVCLSVCLSVCLPGTS
eukprot:SAG22_NODE_2606_length_2391_cov_4.781850_2_plen_148_part_00